MCRKKHYRRIDWKVKQKSKNNRKSSKKKHKIAKNDIEYYRRLVTKKFENKSWSSNLWDYEKLNKKRLFFYITEG